MYMTEAPRVLHFIIIACVYYNVFARVTSSKYRGMLYANDFVTFSVPYGTNVNGAEDYSA